MAYMDECALQIWGSCPATWMKSDDPIVGQQNREYVKSVTVYGAIGDAFTGPVFMLANATNIKNTKRFLVVMAKHRKNPYSHTKVNVVVDNHRAHHNKGVIKLANQRNLNLEFQPSYSPPMNS